MEIFRVYLVFAGSRHEENFGIGDLIGQTLDVYEAKRIVIGSKVYNEHLDIWQIAAVTETGTDVVEEGRMADIDVSNVRLGAKDVTIHVRTTEEYIPVTKEDSTGMSKVTYNRGERQKPTIPAYRDNYDQIDWSKKSEEVDVLADFREMSTKLDPVTYGVKS